MMYLKYSIMCILSFTSASCNSAQSINSSQTSADFSNVTKSDVFYQEDDEFESPGVVFLVPRINKVIYLHTDFNFKIPSFSQTKEGNLQIFILSTVSINSDGIPFDFLYFEQITFDRNIKIEKCSIKIDKNSIYNGKSIYEYQTEPGYLDESYVYGFLNENVYGKNSAKCKPLEKVHYSVDDWKKYKEKEVIE
jgi:hypothetical protein